MSDIGDNLYVGAKCYRTRRDHLWLGSGCLLFFLFALFGMIVANRGIQFKDQNKPLEKALTYYTICIFFIFLSIWMTFDGIRGRLWLSPSIIIARGAFLTRSVCVNEVQMIKWSKNPFGGSVRIITCDQRLKIEFHNYETVVQNPIRSYFRETFDHGKQEDWSEWFAPRLPRPPLPPSRGYLILTAIIFFAFAGFTIYCGFNGGGEGCHIIGAGNIIAGLWFLRRLRTRRR